jgi:hypothetical protein
MKTARKEEEIGNTLQRKDCDRKEHIGDAV